MNATVAGMPNATTATDSATYRSGLDCLCHIEATQQPSIIEGLAQTAPELAELAISFVYGQIYSRPHLTLPQRQLITVAALAALGNARPQLKFHIAGALNVGCSSTEIVELMVHLVVYAGFPVGLNGVFAAQEVFQERGTVPARSPKPTRTKNCPQDARFRAGWDALLRIDGHAGEQVIASLANVAPDLGQFIIEFGFGDIYTRPGLSLVQRELITVAALAALGTATLQLRVHMHGLLNVGGTREQLIETLIHIAAYAGFPAAINAMLTAKDVFAERERE
ncbi:MAG: carboxymuconolactone decarboxylase family protein [Giesbergeria sp.]